MADNRTGLNAQYGAPQFGLDTSGYASTGAPGSASPDTAEATAGPVVGTPVVSRYGESSQLPENRPTLAVHSGDTSSFSDDLPAHESAIEPGPGSAYLATGAGQGSDVTAGHHPNAGR